MDTSTTFDPTNIPPIWGAIPTPPPAKPEKKPDLKLLDNAPNDVTLGGFFGKVIIGAIVGVVVAGFLFALSTAIGGLIDGGNGAPSPILGIVLAVVGFIAGMIGNIVLSLGYTLFFSKRYYAFQKMFGLIFTSSIFLFILMIPFYFLFQEVNTLYIILGIQVIFSFYITSNLIEALAQPNYIASSIIGNTIGFVLSAVVVLAMGLQAKGVDDRPLLLLLPPIAGYTLIVFGLGLWDAIYYKFFEWGNNPFYLPSMAELSKERQEEIEKAEKEGESINVEVN